MLLFLWMGLALANQPLVVAEPAQAAAIESSTPAPPTQRELLDEAVAMRRIGAFDDASQLLKRAAAEPGRDAEQIRYQQGVLAEVTEQWTDAIDAYEDVAARWPDSSSAQDARFRRAYCLEELGDHKAATRAVKQLQRDGRWSIDDERTMALQRGITELRSGKSRRGIRRILKALDSGQDERTWIRAKARLALVRAQLAAAAKIKLKGDKKAARRLVKRAKLLEAGEHQAIVMFKLNEPEFALEGLLLLGDGYVSLYDALVLAPPPRKVKDTEAFMKAVRQKGAILRTKALARYDEGVRVAARTQWVGSVTQRLMTKRDDLAAQLASDGASDAGGVR